METQYMQDQLSSRMNVVKPASTGKVRNLANQLKAEGKDVINFAAGELDFTTPDIVIDSAIHTLKSQSNNYLPAVGLKALREKVAQKEAEQSDIQLDTENICITVGAKHALFSIAMILFQEGDEVILPTPYWGTLKTQIELMGATPVVLDTNNKDYELLFEEFIALVTKKTKAIIINSPNNPTGVVYSKDEIGKILEYARQNNIWVISDECYSKIYRRGNTHKSLLCYDRSSPGNVIVVNSFSKPYAITGWRVGYIVADKGLIKMLGHLLGHMTSNATSVCQYSLVDVIDEDTGEFISMVNQELDARLDIIDSKLQGNKKLRYVKPTGAFYVFLDVSEYIGKKYQEIEIRDVEHLCEMLLGLSQVAVVSGSSFGDSRCIRISYAVSTQDVNIGISRILAFFDNVEFTGSR